MEKRKPGRPKGPVKYCSHCGDPVGPKGAKGYCAKHYARFARHGDPSVSLIDREHSGGPCSECGEPAVARGYCPKCWQRWSKHGDPSIVLPGGREGNRKYTLSRVGARHLRLTRQGRTCPARCDLLAVGHRRYADDEAASTGTLRRRPCRP